MPYDANLQLAALATRTATGTVTSTAVDLGASPGTPRRGLSYRTLIKSIGGTSPTIAQTIEHSSDGTTYTTCVTNPVSSITTTGTFHGTFETPYRYVRSVWVFGGTSPTVQYQCDLGIAKP